MREGGHESVLSSIGLAQCLFGCSFFLERDLRSFAGAKQFTLVLVPVNDYEHCEFIVLNITVPTAGGIDQHRHLAPVPMNHIHLHFRHRSLHLQQWRPMGLVENLATDRQQILDPALFQ
ncbi:hypothetical protein BSU04_01430 [Caballeronia sordidicola]|uniref:Uncharacterized protein n=1 Tax=Caballeronia sordidicola TaxID=196367 RepID=A0A226XAR0_CABSO|nr:hypothetical protein BSU04_01430 [Caballeronia sordidicola]